MEKDSRDWEDKARQGDGTGWGRGNFLLQLGSKSHP